MRIAFALFATLALASTARADLGSTFVKIPKLGEELSQVTSHWLTDPTKQPKFEHRQASQQLADRLQDQLGLEDNPRRITTQVDADGKPTHTVRYESEDPTQTQPELTVTMQEFPSREAALTAAEQSFTNNGLEITEVRGNTLVRMSGPALERDPSKVRDAAWGSNPTPTDLLSVVRSPDEFAYRASFPTETMTEGVNKALEKGKQSPKAKFRIQGDKESMLVELTDTVSIIHKTKNDATFIMKRKEQRRSPEYALLKQLEREHPRRTTPPTWPKSGKPPVKPTKPSEKPKKSYGGATQALERAFR